MACLPRCCWAVLPDGVIQHIFYIYGVILNACVHGRRKLFIQGSTSGFFQKFSLGGIKSGEFCFLPLKTKRTGFFAEIYKFLHPFRHRCLFCRKQFVPHHLKFGVISSVLTPFWIAKFCWILYAKWTVWQINFNCVFVFALPTLNSYIYFCIANTTDILVDNLLVATYALSCLCIPVSNAVVEWVFSNVTSVFKMWKSCDFDFGSSIGARSALCN